ncbi:MAG: TldD/PmbA family protein [Bacteroidales bacterium]|nr:TldD/PmbA family protein [Bacteroidales bacterium]
MLSTEERIIARESLQMALDAGAQKARVSLSKNTMNLIATLDAQIDKITSCLDRSISLNLYVDGRYGSFSTNKLERASLKDFIGKAVATTRMLAEDRCRDLPDGSRTVKDAVDGNELGITDPAFAGVDDSFRSRTATENALQITEGDGWKLVSQEGEYSDSEYWNLVLDSNGLEALHGETSFEFFTELTIEDAHGNKYSGGWWEASPLLKDFHPEKVAQAALQEAVMQIGPKRCRSGKYKLVIDSEVSSKVVSPILNALNAFNIQQGNSFLKDTAGRQVFPAGLNIMDIPRTKGEPCGKLFDSEGVATSNHAIIENGVVKEYFVNTYMANKLGIAPTAEDAIRPMVMPFAATGREDIMQLCGDGILVTDFCGGNCNIATGAFSYAIQGYRFKEGRIVHPVREMLITGDILSLWSRLIAAGSDARRCRAKLTPTLAFDAVDFSG